MSSLERIYRVDAVRSRRVEIPAVIIDSRCRRGARVARRSRRGVLGIPKRSGAKRSGAEAGWWLGDPVSPDSTQREWIRTRTWMESRRFVGAPCSPSSSLVVAAKRHRRKRVLRHVEPPPPPRVESRRVGSTRRPPDSRGYLPRRRVAFTLVLSRDAMRRVLTSCASCSSRLEVVVRPRRIHLPRPPTSSLVSLDDVSFSYPGEPVCDSNEINLPLLRGVPSDG